MAESAPEDAKKPSPPETLFDFVKEDLTAGNPAGTTAEG